MPQYAVCCAYDAAWTNHITIEADNIKDACKKAIDIANLSDSWDGADDCGPTYILAINEGEDVDWAAPYSLIPRAFQEEGVRNFVYRVDVAELLDACADLGTRHAECLLAGNELKTIVLHDHITRLLNAASDVCEKLGD